MIPKNLLDAGYVLEKEYTEGGQSKTYILVKNKEKFILKVPKEENLPKERIFRFSNEINAMKLLDGDGIPRIFD